MTKLDQFYTPKHTSKWCAEILKPFINKDSLLLEPSAGEGAFLEALSFHKGRVVAIDLEPKCKGITKLDFFLLERSDIDDLVCVGNPPFGKNSSLAVRFFNHAAFLGAGFIAFIVPKTFRKVSLQRRLHINFHLLVDVDLPSDNFELPDGTERRVPCCWQIWKREKEPRPTQAPPTQYVRTTEKEKALVAIRRVGGKAGHVLGGFNHAKASTLYLTGSEEVVRFLKSDAWYPPKERDNSAGMRSITVDEINKHLGDIYDRI